MVTTRRDFIEKLSLAGGYSAAFLGMEALGLLHAPPATAQQFGIPSAHGKNRSVVILGAGIAGLVAGYELKKAGWNVTVVEASRRVGGRAWTIRKGDMVKQVGRDDQSCRFDQGLYFDAGAMRIPHSHHTILGYARELQVQLEVMVNSNRAARLDLGGRVFSDRELRSVVRGNISSLLAKALDRKSLDAELSSQDRQILRAFLSLYGELDQRGDYVVQGRSGFAEPPGGYDDTGRFRDRIALSDVLRRPGAFLPLVLEEFFDQQAPMFQPVGGMDQIAVALHRKIKSSVRLDAVVTAIRRVGDRVRIEIGQKGQPIEADCCICTLPPHLLARIPADFAQPKREALRDVGSLPAVKLAFQAPRFWQDDGIFGGLGWTDELPENLVYPSGDWHAKDGILVAAYVAGWTGADRPSQFGGLPFAEQQALCRRVVERLHPGSSARLVHPIVVDWSRVLFAEGVGVGHPDWSVFPRPSRYSELMKPEGTIFFAGDHLSHVTLWQEGAALSAQSAIKTMVTQVAT